MHAHIQKRPKNRSALELLFPVLLNKLLQRIAMGTAAPQRASSVKSGHAASGKAFRRVPGYSCFVVFRRRAGTNKKAAKCSLFVWRKRDTA